MPKVDFVIPGRSRECRFPLCVKIPPCSLVIGSPLRNQTTSALGLAWTRQITSVSSLELVCINVCSCITSGASEMKNQNRYNIRTGGHHVGGAHKGRHLQFEIFWPAKAIFGKPLYIWCSKDQFCCTLCFKRNMIYDRNSVLVHFDRSEIWWSIKMAVSNSLKNIKSYVEHPKQWLRWWGVQNRCQRNTCRFHYDGEKFS